MASKNLIVLNNLQPIVNQLRRDGLNNSAIARHIAQYHGISVSRESVRRYFENIAIEEVVQEVVSQAPERVVKLATDMIVENVSTVQRMEPIINDLEKALEKLKDKNGNISDMDQYLDIIDKLRHYYNMRAKLLGDLQPKTAFTQNNVIFYIPDNHRDTTATR